MGKRKGVNYFFYIAFFMGDTVEHNKLCILCGGPNATCLFQSCDFERKQELKKKGKNSSQHIYID